MEDINQQLHEVVLGDTIESVKELLKQGTGDWTALHIAALIGLIDVTKYQITEGAEANKGDNSGWTALHVAAHEGHLEVTKYLIGQLGAEINQGDNDGNTALWFAAFSGHLDVTKYLISHGAAVNNRNNEGRTALHSAAHAGHLDITQYLISQGADVNKGDYRGLTALHKAPMNGHLDVTKYLISQGAEVNKGDNEGVTALHSATKKGHFDITKYLISQRADANKGDNEGRTALHSAVQEGHLDLTKYLIGHGAEVNKDDKNSRTALRSAAFNGNLEITKYLICQGAEVNKGDNEGRTALHEAVQKGHLDVTKYLIGQGAEVKKGDNEGRTALHRAAQKGHLDVTKYLFRQGAEVNQGDIDGRTALHSAAQEGHLGVTKYLLTQGISVDMVDRNGYTPLHIAATNGDFAIVKVLLKKGGLVDVKDAHGQTPLHISSKKGSANSSDILAIHAQITGILDHRDDEGLTAIHLATQNGHTPVVESLVSHGASLNIQSQDGKTCLHEAIILSDHRVRKQQTKGRSKQISEDFDQHELSPEKALVLYILEHGARLDIRDGEGKLPIHYATNEVTRQMIIAKIPSIEMITRNRAEEAIPLAMVSAHVDNGGKQIELADLGITMSIPLGAVQESGSYKITLTSVQDPPSINQEVESVACYGIRCDPSNTIFHQPVKISIPHSYSIVNPDQVKPEIVCRVLDSAKDLPITSRMRSSSSQDDPPYCRVYKRHFELYIGHCAEWWVLIPLEQQVTRHQLMCTPYIPDKIERGKEFEVHLQMHADLPGMETDIREEMKQQSYHKSHRSVPFSVKSKSGDVTVTCHREGELVESKVLSLTDVQSNIRHSILLSVTPSEDNVEFTRITITITQAGRLGVSRSIVFIIRHTDGPEYQPLSNLPSFRWLLEEVAKSELPDIDILAIVKTMTVDHFYDLGVALGFTIQQLDVIEYRRFHDRGQAIYDMLVKWRERQLSGQAAKETFLSLLKSLDSPAGLTF